MIFIDVRIFDSYRFSVQLLNYIYVEVCRVRYLNFAKHRVANYN